MASPTAITIHPERTRRRNLQYQFTPKHHGGDRDAARWRPDLTDDEEFSVFDLGDYNDISDTSDYLFGILPGSDGDLRIIGYWNEQIGEFPFARANQPWHGYPCWPLLGDTAPTNRKSPDKMVFQKLREKELITEQQRKRLVKGDDA